MQIMINKETIQKWWNVFVGDGRFTEVRILGKFTYSGYFKSVDNLVSQIEPYSNMEDEQIYFTLNTIDPACYGRQQSEKIVKSPKITTNDNDIIHRDWVMCDFDPIRKSGTNASEEEFELAHQKAQEVFRFLRDKGFEAPVICKSGNGWHLLYKIDVNVSDEATETIKGFFKYMGMKFSDDRVEFDEKNFNAARVCKLYGTMAKKGANLQDRPWRMSEIVYSPAEIKVTPLEKFKELADLLPKEEPKSVPNRNFRNQLSTNSPFDLVTWLNAHGVVYREKKTGASTLYELEYCPWVDTHSDKKKWDSALFQDTDGKITFNCTHSHCKGKTWQDVRLFYEPDAYDKPQWQPQPHRQYQPMRPKYEIKGEIPELGKKWLTMSSIKKVDLSKIDGVKTGFEQLDRSIVKLHYGEVTVISGSNACVDCDTEYFNGTQWKKISEFSLGESVLQYNPDGSANLVVPQRYIKTPCDELYLIQSITGVDQCVSGNHNLIYMTSKGNLAKKRVDEMLIQHENSRKGFSGKFYTTFSYNEGVGIDLSDIEIRLMCAIICEGSFSVNFRDKNIVRINIKKQRKKERLEMLLKQSGIPFRKEQYNPKDLQYNTYLFHAPRKEKEFLDYWYKCNAKQLSIVADEILHWDGTINLGKRKISSYSSTSKRNIDFVQFAFASVGVRTHIHVDDRVGKRHSDGKYIYKSICYQLTICRTKNPSIVNPKIKKQIGKIKTKDGYKYCFTVPSGMLVLRRNGNINITGNSGKSSWLNTLILNIANQGVPSALWSGELPEPILKAWIQMVAAGKNNLRMSQFGDGKFFVPQNIGDQIDKWLDNLLFIYNTEYGNQWEQLLADMEVMYNAGIKVFILDNLMAMNIDLLEGDKNNKQKTVILKVKEFAKKKNVHVILVAHPRKSMAFLRKNDISGTADLTNAVDNIFIMHRVNNDFLRQGEEFFGKGNMKQFDGFGNVLEVCKNRMYGIVDLFVGMHYELESRRFKNTIDENVKYGWELPPQQITFNYQEDHCANYEGDEPDNQELDPLGLPITGDAPF